MITTSIRYGLAQEYALDVQVEESEDDEFNWRSAFFGLAKQYRDLGYVIHRKLINHNLCGALINSFQYEVKPYEGGLFRQISMLKVPHKFKSGLMVNGFLNCQDLSMFPAFQAASIATLSHPEVQRIIHALTAFRPTLIESTFWETTTVGTPLHRDGDYVNSARGILTGMWIALEDIAPDAGRLCLVPRSHRPEMWGGHLDKYDYETKIPSGSLRLDLKRRFEQGAMLHEAIQLADLPVIAPRLNQGDAIFWDGRIVHGSLPPAKATTRYSIAGHYIPSDDVLIKHGRLVEFESQTSNGMKLRRALHSQVKP